MKLPNEFEYYINKGIIRKISPDKPRAEFLIKYQELQEFQKKNFTDYRKIL